MFYYLDTYFFLNYTLLKNSIISKIHFQNTFYLYADSLNAQKYYYNDYFYLETCQSVFVLLYQHLIYGFCFYIQIYFHVNSNTNMIKY